MNTALTLLIITPTVGPVGNRGPELQHLPHFQDVRPVLAAVVGGIAGQGWL